MLPDGRVTRMFAGEERQFLVQIGQLREIQKVCAAGPATVANRLGRLVAVRKAKPDASMIDLILTGLGDWRVDDVRVPILEGLVAGGMSTNDAAGLVRKEIDDRGFRGLFENADLALELIVAGVEAEPVGEPKAAATTKTRPPRKAKATS